MLDLTVSWFFRAPSTRSQLTDLRQLDKLPNNLDNRYDNRLDACYDRGAPLFFLILLLNLGA